VLTREQVPWSEGMLWAPDVTVRNGTYYFYFPAHDLKGVFKIGMATSPTPVGPFTVHPHPIPQTFSVDPCVFQDTDNDYYLYFGGLGMGQLQLYGDKNETFGPAVGPFAGRLAPNMRSFVSKPKEIEILDENGSPLQAMDHSRRFFEASWMHKYQGKYYLSYSTGETHLIVYATSTSPLGPFTYQGVILTPVLGWTTHHSIAQIDSEWWLFFHDSERSKGITDARNVKAARLTYDKYGRIQPLNGLTNVAIHF